MTQAEARRRIQRVLTQAWNRRGLQPRGATITVSIWTWGADDEYTWSVAPATLNDWTGDIVFDQETLRAAFGDTPSETADWSFVA
jgi:GH35 family endo-1,4-beta-xylanase